MRKRKGKGKGFLCQIFGCDAGTTTLRLGQERVHNTVSTDNVATLFNIDRFLGKITLQSGSGYGMAWRQMNAEVSYTAQLIQAFHLSKYNSRLKKRLFYHLLV